MATVTRKAVGKLAKEGPTKTITPRRIVIQRCETCRFWNDNQCYRITQDGAKLRVVGSDEVQVFTDYDFGCVQGDA